MYIQFIGVIVIADIYKQLLKLNVPQKMVSTMSTLYYLFYRYITWHEYDVTTMLVIRHGQELSATLLEQQNAILEKIKFKHTELMNLGESDAFCRGFSLAVRLMVDAMHDKKQLIACIGKRHLQLTMNTTNAYSVIPIFMD